ncbi:trans-aconitate 2-methyltransferase [Arthrobacter oryzae]|nr:class I SAM-dependent methyltransferase [Arthrobacter oryzae]
MTTLETAPGTPVAEPTPQEQGAALLGQIAGYMAVRTVEMGIRSGLIRFVADNPGSTANEIADRMDLDDLYVSVWCRGGFGAGILDRQGDGFVLAPHMATLLLDETSPAFMGGLFPLVRQPEMFDRFAANLDSGARLWWDDTSPDWIDSVKGASKPFNTRLIPGGLSQIEGLAERLHLGGRIVDTACGAGQGLIKLAQSFPQCDIVGVDGDQHSIDQARAEVRDAGLADRVTLVCSPLEDMVLDTPAALIINNLSMHECRDIDAVTERIKAALEPGGWFVISDFPFPSTDEGLRTVPGRVMSGVQFFEAQIDDQLLPRVAYDLLLDKHGFTGLGSFPMTPMHAVTYARTPG